MSLPDVQHRLEHAMRLLASSAETEVERLLRAFLNAPGGKAYAGKTFAVGGYVRDEFMGGSPKDLDLVVEANGGAERLTRLLKQHLGAAVSGPRQLGQGYPIWQLVFKADVQFGGETYRTAGADVEVADTMTESFPDPNSRQREVRFGTLEEDAVRRDMTINMLYKNIATGAFEDVTGMAADDLRAGTLRHISTEDGEASLIADPLRMIRYVRFAVKLGFRIDPETAALIRKNAKRIGIVSAERVMGELEKLMTLGKLSQALPILRELGLLVRILPEIDALADVQHDPRHHQEEGGVLGHTLMVLEHAPPTLEGQLAALLHDVGKAATQEFLEDKITFHGHEDVGADMALAILKRLKFPSDVAERVSFAVANHMRPHQLADAGSPRALRKFVRDMGEALEDVLSLAHADALGKVPADDYMRELRKRLEKVKEIPVARKPILNGEEVMTLLRIAPGPLVGRIQRWLTEQEDEYASRGEALSKEQALALVKQEFGDV